jgi:paraquat-inducible protein A
MIHSAHIYCDQCDLENTVPSETAQHHCKRCNHLLKGISNPSYMHTLVYALTALIFYIPALAFPFMSVEMNGIRNSSTIWQGVNSLMETGSWFIALIVFMASIVIPLLKLIILFYLGLPTHTSTNALLKTRLFRFVENIGRWSMLDIFLLAVLVAILKISPWTFVEPEIGAFLFAFVVIFSMCASASFDPRLLWKDIQ